MRLDILAFSDWLDIRNVTTLQAARTLARFALEASRERVSKRGYYVSYERQSGMFTLTPILTK
jgi:hypothetical protein